MRRKNMTNGKLFGNEKINRLIRDEISRGVFSHAYIIEGESGSGRTTAAKNIIAAVCCKSDDAPCLTCDSCRRIFDDLSADIKFIKKPDDRATIGVDSVREIFDNIYFKPADIDVRAYIITPAEKMTVQAQNSLLKILEEPPEGTLFFLITENASDLLDTVRSRCRTLKTEALDKKTLKEMLFSSSAKAKRAFEDGNIGEDIFELWRGNYTSALMYFESQNACDNTKLFADAVAEDTIKRLEQPKETILLDLILYLTSQIKTREQYEAFLQALEKKFAEALMKQKCENECASALSPKIIFTYYKLTDEFSAQASENPPITAALTAFAISLVQKR